MVSKLHFINTLLFITVYCLCSVVTLIGVYCIIESLLNIFNFSIQDLIHAIKVTLVGLSGVTVTFIALMIKLY